MGLKLYFVLTGEKDAANKIWEMTKCFHATDPKVNITLLVNSVFCRDIYE